jgi:hypothetical protein
MTGTSSLHEMDVYILYYNSIRIVSWVLLDLINMEKL